MIDFPKQKPADKSPEEALLLGAIAEGDKGSFQELHQRYAGVIFSTVYRVLNDQQDAEDVSQEVFHQIWNKAHLYQQSKGKPLTWVATMARNRAIDCLRSKQRRARLRDDFEDEVTGLEETAETMDSSDRAYAHERQSILRTAVMELSPEQREAIELAYFAGLTQLEVAQRLGQPLGTIKARIRRGVTRLQDKLRRRL